MLSLVAAQGRQVSPDWLMGSKTGLVNAVLDILALPPLASCLHRLVLAGLRVHDSGDKVPQEAQGYVNL